MTTTKTKTAQHEQWQSILYHALNAGDTAAAAHTPRPMVVFSPNVPFVDETPDLSQPVYHVPDGPCGFAWVNLTAKKGPEGKEARQFLNWLMGRTVPADGCAPIPMDNYRLPYKKAYGGGYNIWVSGFRQSAEIKFHAACHVADALQKFVPGLIAWPQERLD